MMIRQILAVLLIAAAAAPSAEAQTSIASPALIERAVAASTPPRFSVQSQPSRDSRVNGFLIGVVAGAVPGVLLGAQFNRYCHNEATSCPTAIFYGGAALGLVGGLIGFAVDDAIGKSATLGRARPTPGLRLSVKF